LTMPLETPICAPLMIGEWGLLNVVEVLSFPRDALSEINSGGIFMHRLFPPNYTVVRLSQNFWFPVSDLDIGT